MPLSKPNASQMQADVPGFQRIPSGGPEQQQTVQQRQQAAIPTV